MHASHGHSGPPTKDRKFLKRVGIVGVGRMGANLARRLFDNHVPIGAIYDIRRDVAKKLAGEFRCVAAERLAEVTAESDVVITIITDDAAFETIYAETGDSLLLGGSNTVFIDCSTVSPRMHVEADHRAVAHRAQFLEACMAGSISQARDGSLFLICGGDKALYESMMPLFELMSTNRVYVGPTPAAAQVKALVNMVMNINTAGLAEGLALAEALGISLDVIRDVFSRTGAASRVLVTDGEDMQKRDHQTYFSAAHAAKDSGIASQLAREAGVDVPLAEAAKAQYDRMVAAGIGHLDKSGVSELTFRERRKHYAEAVEGK